MKKLIIAISLLIACPAWAENSKLEVRGTVDDDSDILMSTGLIVKNFTTGARQSQKLSIDSATFSAFTVPSGAKAVLIDVGTSTGLHLKGVSADTGISLDNTVPVLLPLSDDIGVTTLGLRNDGPSTQTVKIYWF